MKTLRKLASVLGLMLVLGLPAFAGQTDSLPCTPPAPGQTDSLPCQPTAPPTGDTGGAPNSSTATVANTALTEIATGVLESMLSIL